MRSCPLRLNPVAVMPERGCHLSDSADPIPALANVKVDPAVIRLLVLLVVCDGLRIAAVAPLLGFTRGAVSWHVQDTRVRFDRLFDDEKLIRHKQMGKLKFNLLRNSKDKLKAEATLFEAMTFPRSNESVAHVQRLLSFVAKSSQTIEMCPCMRMSARCSCCTTSPS